MSGQFMQSVGKHLQKELIILRHNLAAILLCIFFNYVHAVAHNLAYYLHVPSEPLFDLGFALLPGLNKQLQILSEIAFFLIIITGVCFMISPLVKHNTKLFRAALDRVDPESLEELYVVNQAHKTNILTLLSRTLNLSKTGTLSKSFAPEEFFDDNTEAPYPPPASLPGYDGMTDIEFDDDIEAHVNDNNNNNNSSHHHQFQHHNNNISQYTKKLQQTAKANDLPAGPSRGSTLHYLSNNNSGQGEIELTNQHTKTVSSQIPSDGSGNQYDGQQNKYEHLWPGQDTVCFNAEQLGTHAPMYGFQILTRFLSVLCLSQALRTVCFLVTGLPGPNYHCRPFSQFYNPPKDLAELLGRSDAFFSCGDLVFSSHTTFILLCALLYTKYGQSAKGKFAFWCLVGVFCSLVIAARKHYTLDIFIACYTVPLLWHVFDMYCPDEIPVELARMELKFAEELSLQ